MNETKFHQLALLAKMRNSKAKQAAFLCLVKGYQQQAAATATGITQPTVSQAINRLRQAQAAAFRAARP